MTDVRWLMVLTENEAILDPRDLGALVDLAVTAEANGIDGVMLSEHIVLGPSAGANGVMENPRDYAYPGNQETDMSWPSSVVLLSGIATVTESLRLVAAAIVARLRRPVASGEGAEHPRPAVRGTARGHADRQLARGRVRSTGSSLQQARRDP